MDLDFFFGTTAAPPKPSQQTAAVPGAFDFFPQQTQQSTNSQQPAYAQQAAYQPAYQQPAYQQPYAQQPQSQPFFASPGYSAQPGYGASPVYQPFGAGPASSAQPFYAPAPAPVRSQPTAILSQSTTKPTANPNNDLFDMFGGDVLGGGSAQPQAQAPPPAQPQTIQYSNDDFFDLLGASSSKASPQPTQSAAPSKPAPAPVQTAPVSTFKRGQSKKEAAAKKDLNLDAFSQLAVSRQKTPAGTASSVKKVAESESESESESEDEDDSSKGPRNIDDDEHMGTGQGFSPVDHNPRGGGGGGSTSSTKKCVAADCNNTFQGAGKYCAAHQRYETHPPEAKDADGRKVKGEWSIERKRTGTKMGFIKNITIWKFYFKGEQHTIELRHSTFSGKRVILVDRRQLLSEKRLIGGDAAHKVFAGSDFETRCEVTVVIKSNNDRFQYGIFIEGLPIRDAKLKYAEYV